MLPDINDDLQRDFHYTTLPGRSHRIDFKNGVISGYVDGIEAVKQSVYLILSTERTEFEIYSWDYGVEVQPNLGLPMELVQTRIKNTIIDALMQDDRIKGVNSFAFTEKNKNQLRVTFVVISTEGPIETGWTFAL